MLEIVYIMAYHSHKRHLLVLLFFTYLFITCKNPEDKIASEKPLSITKEIAENLSHFSVEEYNKQAKKILSNYKQIIPKDLHCSIF